MTTKCADKLTWSAVNSFGGRKKPGRVSIIVDEGSGMTYLVPREIEHKDYLCEILSTTPEALRGKPERASRLIPAHIDLVGDNVESLLIGLSGAEETYNIRHSRKDLEEAARFTRAFVEHGEVPISGDLKVKIDYRYAEKNSHRNL